LAWNECFIWYIYEGNGQDFLRVETASLFHFVDADSASASHITLHCKAKIQSKLQTHKCNDDEWSIYKLLVRFIIHAPENIQHYY